jgi:thiol:disulfide interchange protein DsbD
MGAALGFALSQSALVTLAVFSALAVGMALPFALLAAFPGWQRRLPRPGLWMLRLKQLLAFPLYATVIWLAWVLGVQLGVDAILRLLATLLAVALGLWLLFGQGPRRSGAALAFGVAAIAAATVLAWPVLAGGWAASPSAGADAVTGSETFAGATRGATGAQGPRKAAASPWERWSPQRLGELDAAGKAVFVDFTAAWCVTCQVNKQLVLERDAVLAAFRERGVTLLRADWTRHDPEITRALQSLGRNGVPVYVLYRPGKAPMLLPEILQESSIRAALASI